MRTYPTTAVTAQRSTAFIPQIFIALVGGLTIFFVLFGAVITGFNVLYAGRIFPGVAVAGVDLSGLQPEQAAARIQTRLDYPSRGRLLFKDGEKLWLASPSQVGFYLDPQATTLAALRFGRRGDPVTRLFDQFRAWYLGVSLSPMYVYDERAADSFLRGIATQIDAPKVEAALNVEGVNVVVVPGQVGRRLDIPATLDDLRAQLQTLRDSEIFLTVDETPPAILNADEQAQIARQILSQPLVISVPDAGKKDPGPWTFEPQDLAKMLTIARVASEEGERYQVGLETERLRSFLEGLAPELARGQENARFIFNDDTRQVEVIEPAKIGRALDIDKTMQGINQKLLAGEHQITLDLEFTQPEVGDDATAEQLGITELVSDHTSYFYGSSGERIQNIATAAARFHGLLVPPGATFSMGAALGDVSLDTGYAEALIIFGNRTIQGVGGGVCQVSTTLFRTAFFGGFPIVERHQHAYRVGYYELRPDGGYDTDLAGLDATVYMPLVDFKFTNDTPSWLLMETYVDEGGRTLTWKFYSTSDGREVEWETTGLKHTEKPPKPVYEENPELAKGEVKQVDWEVEGADVSVTRTVRRGGEVLYNDTINTHYIPWRAVFEYGPGTKGMPPKDKDKDD